MWHRSACVIPLLPWFWTAACSVAPDRDGVFDETAAEAEIRQLEHDWAQVAVTGDPGVVERIFAEDFVGVDPSGATYTKQGFIDDTVAHPLGCTSNELNAVRVRFYGITAVAQGDETFTRKGGERGRFVWTDTLVRRNGQWRIVAAQDAIAAPAASAGSALFAGAAAPTEAPPGIARTRNAYAAAWRNASASQITALYTEDALVLYPNQPPVSGRAQIQDYFTGFFGQFPKNEFELTSDEVTVTGDWAFDRGTYRWTGTPPTDVPERDEGKYLVILQRQADGTWKVARDMDNSNRPAAQATRGAR
ncbi:MAG TPA: SgcJ/EcaC family oxidoreductase [Planctomycetota bacterium]|nr:SgcJ/EcaC family oxidoreductase [Planctomycetota bacterium]